MPSYIPIKRVKSGNIEFEECVAAKHKQISVVHLMADDGLEIFIGLCYVVRYKII